MRHHPLITLAFTLCWLMLHERDSEALLEQLLSHRSRQPPQAPAHAVAQCRLDIRGYWRGRAADPELHERELHSNLPRDREHGQGRQEVQ